MPPCSAPSLFSLMKPMMAFAESIFEESYQWTKAGSGRNEYNDCFIFYYSYFAVEIAGNACYNILIL